MKAQLFFNLVLATGALLPLALSPLALAQTPQKPQNLLKNGSFEGGLRYWYGARNATLEKGAPSGEWAPKLPAGKWLESAAVELKQGQPVTLSFFAKAEVAPEKTATMGWQLAPCHRDLAVAEGLAFGIRYKRPLQITSEWKRYSFSFTPTTPQSSFWPSPTYMLQIGECEAPYWLDGITLTYGEAPDYTPRRAVEVQLNTPDFPGYTSPAGNVFSQGATVKLGGSVFNPEKTAKTVSVQWQFFDYWGQKPLGAPVTQSLEVPALSTRSRTIAPKLPAKGLVLARFSALENGKILDSSDLPLTSLPYPQPLEAKPDMRERFGSSLFGPHNAQLTAKLGLRWARWGIETRWNDLAPENPDQFLVEALDAKMRAREKLGISNHLVLYGWPKWAENDHKNPLPNDMRWPDDDPRWNDLSVTTNWDKFVTKMVNHFKDRPVVFELANEPEFDGWQDANYTNFFARTARLIKKLAPNARVMVNNVYAIPSGINAALLKKAGKDIDIISWHDYKAGWLSTGVEMRRMKNRLEALGCGHLEIWFNEGWSYTNTAQDEPALALTGLSAAQNTDAMVASIAEITLNGQEKTIIFHSGYETHGMSYWDYAGPGTMLWDYNDWPLPLVPAWNTLSFHLGRSKPVAWIRPENANLCIYQDERNGRGVMLVYADRDAKTDGKITLPWADAVVEDIMGNAQPLNGKTLTLPRNGRPFWVYTRSKLGGAAMAKTFASLDRKNQNFAEGAVYKLPKVWDGDKIGTASGNPILANGKPIWRLTGLWPDDPSFAGHYESLIWNGTDWISEKNGLAGQPSVRVEDGKLRVAVRAPWTGAPGQRTGGVAFIAPKNGRYKITGTVAALPWEGASERYPLTLYKRDTQRATKESEWLVTRSGSKLPFSHEIELSQGHELIVLPQAWEWHNAINFSVEDLQVELLR